MKINTLKKYTGKYSRKEKRNWLFLALLSIFMFFTLFQYYQSTSKNIELQRMDKLKQENDVSTHYFKSLIRQKQDWLEMFAYSAGMTEKEEREDWWEFLKKFDSADSRVGVTNLDGIMYFGNQQARDVHEKDYFKEAVKGKSYISPINENGMYQHDSIILSVPLRHIDGEILGTAVMEYTVLNLGQYINTYDTDWGSYGANLIIDSAGRVVASPGGMEQYDTIYEMLATKDWKDKHDIEVMKKDVAEGKQGCLEYSFEGAGRMMFYKPMDFHGWTMVTIGAMDKYLPMLNEISNLHISFMIVISAILLCMFFAISNLIRCKNERIISVKKDVLTNVYTRHAGEEILNYDFRQNGKPSYYGCMFIDIDDFKFFNDSHGHDKGDDIIKNVGDMLNASSRDQDLIYRYGGDEFCIWLHGNGSRKEIEKIGQRILGKRCDAGTEIHLSIGATVIEKDDNDWKTVLKRADKALYLAKERGKNQIAFQDSE